MTSSASGSHVPDSSVMKAVKGPFFSANNANDFLDQLKSPATFPTIASKTGSVSARESASISRLQSIARYHRFRPSVLACSPPISNVSAGTPLGQSATTSPSGAAPPAVAQDGIFTSLGALAGPKGVAIFRVTAPESPLLILSHKYRLTNTFSPNKSESGIASMAFQTNSTYSLYLAAARGNGLLVWDVSGHSLNPLMARMGIGGLADTQADHGRVVSIDWHGPGDPCLLGLTPSSAYLWDLRDHSSAGASSANVFSKPSLRFGGSQGPGLMSSYIQLASSSDSGECALLDAQGTVRVFDLRMVTNKNNHSKTLFEARVHDYAGIGIRHVPSSVSPQTRWVTWGMDSVMGNPVVRMWQQQESDSLNYNQRTDSALETTITQTDSWKDVAGWNLIFERESPNLACTRVCPSLEDAVFIVSQKQTTDDAAMEGRSACWTVDLWNEIGSQWAKKLTFRAGPDADKKIQGMLGPEAKLGALCGCDLALSSVQRLLEVDPPGNEDNYAFVERREEPAVLLLSLTDTGFLTSHVMPEAISATLKKNEKLTPYIELRRSTFGAQARIYSDGSDIPFGDVPWTLLQDDTKNKTSVRETPSIQVAPQASAVDLMPFDLDVAAVFTHVESDRPTFQPDRDILISQEEKSSNIKLLGKDSIGPVDDTRKAAALMEKIETRKIPCPRLCGASFGPAAGGLVSFHNGEVRKMWKWYTGEISIVRRNLPSSFRENDLSGLESGTRDTCRTLKDLFDMMKASKESQWGEHHDSDVMAGVQNQVNDNFFEDEESEEGEQEDSSQSGSAEDLAEAGSAEEQKVSKTSSDNFTPEHTLIKSMSNAMSPSKEEEATPSSDVLTPHVSIFQHIDVTLLNGQSPALALRWKLGRWASFAVTPSVDRDPLTSVAALDMSTRSLKSRLRVNSDQGSLSKYGNQRRDKISGTHSDPMMQISPARQALSFHEEDRGVHGGEYSVRPNMQESVDFLRKLFIHQREGGDTPGMGSMVSPPDKRMMPSPGQSNHSPGRHRRVITQPKPQTGLRSSEGGEIAFVKPGVYTLSSTGFLSVEAQERLHETRDLCSHNADVCRALGDNQKADVWDVLAEMVCGRLSAGSLWNQKLKTSLVSSFLSGTLMYLEKIGDVQMLSHLVCVLRIPTADLQPRERAQCTFLPADSTRYNSYIRIYSRLLYAWGLLSHCAELKKHLSLVQEDPLEVPFETNVETIQCVVCGEKNNNGPVLCKTCNAYMFRCIICENAVRGLFTFCIVCGHGGHICHMREFFEKRKECPSGCGCNCVLSSGPKQERILMQRFRQKDSDSAEII